jgi:hypothetical protein
MNAFNRVFVSLLALMWCAVLGGALLMVWDLNRQIDWNHANFRAVFDVISLTRSEQILGTIVIGLLLLPAVMLMAFEMKPSGRDARDMHRDGLEKRVEAMQRQLEAERRRPVVVNSETERLESRGRWGRMLPWRR